MNLMILGQNDLILVSFFLIRTSVVVPYMTLWLWSKGPRVFVSVLDPLSLRSSGSLLGAFDLSPTEPSWV